MEYVVNMHFVSKPDVLDVKLYFGKAVTGLCLSKTSHISKITFLQ